MKKLLLTLSIIALAISVKSQTYLNHGIGTHIGVYGGDKLKSYGGDYELSFLNNNKGYAAGFVTGISASFAQKEKEFTDRDFVADQRRNAFYLNVGYRMSIFSAGISGGIKTQRHETAIGVKETSSLFGGWVGVQPTRFIKIVLGGNDFNGFKVGLIFIPNTIGSNRR